MHENTSASGAPRAISVAAKRYALAIYRDRRRGGGDPLDHRPRLPLDAMESTIAFFAGHLAWAVDQGDDARVAQLLDGWRASKFYLKQLRSKSWRLSRPVAPLAALPTEDAPADAEWDRGWLAGYQAGRVR